MTPLLIQQDTEVKTLLLDQVRSLDMRAPDWLLTSMGTLGQLQPIIVCPENGGWRVVAGDKRTAAARALGNTTIEAKIYPDMDAANHAAAMVRLAENYARAPSPVADAEAAAKLTDEEALDVAGLNRAQRKHIARYVNLAPEFTAMVLAGDLAHGGADQLLKLPSHEAQRQAWARATEICATRKGRKVSVKDVSQAVREIRFPPQPTLMSLSQFYDQPSEQAQPTPVQGQPTSDQAQPATPRAVVFKNGITALQQVDIVIAKADDLYVDEDRALLAQALAVLRRRAGGE